MRQMALEYVTGCLQGGNSRLAAYRNTDRPTFVAREFAGMIDRMPFLATYVPDLRRTSSSFRKPGCRMRSRSCIGRTSNSD